MSAIDLSLMKDESFLDESFATIDGDVYFKVKESILYHSEGKRASIQAKLSITSKEDPSIKALCTVWLPVDLLDKDGKPNKALFITRSALRAMGKHDLWEQRKFNPSDLIDAEGECQCYTDEYNGRKNTKVKKWYEKEKSLTQVNSPREQAKDVKFDDDIPF